MSINTRTATKDMSTFRYLLVAALVALVFFMSYGYAVAKNGGGLDGELGFDTQGFAAAGGGGCCGSGGGSAAAPGAGGGGGCCAGGGSGEPIEGETTVEGDVQRISVDASAGYNPNVIRAQAGVPIEITFSEGYGCMAQVMSRDFGFFEDLTTGPKTIALPALEAGEYSFSCGMEMVFGTIVVE